MNFEPVHEVDEYYDGPRGGIASFNGSLYRFRSRYLDATEYKGEFASVDVFELIPIGGASGREPILATALFRSVADQPASEPGRIRQLEVAWQLASDSVQPADAADCPKTGGG
ncbi:MAG: hypothetical protein IRZ28_07575 [Steroidobacteraceae bacterium]|nr:hypothetical protein [Steroidobacteraceae bacterium]